jgi:hypothetical protein
MSDPPTCRRCEYWLPGTLDMIETAAVGECLSKHSHVDRAPADHFCPHFSEDANRYERAPSRTRTTRRAMGHG